mmetsp:Transcript_180/g.460  ORF Transcript_180/g.460 Transcript_180/m.460 type:complete len:87 (+) Transcript_180:95-355(+)
MSTKYDHMMDEIIEGLCSLLEYCGVFSDDEDNCNDDANEREDPWARISKNLKAFLVSLGKLYKLLPTGGGDGGEVIVTFDEKMNCS